MSIIHLMMNRNIKTYGTADLIYCFCSFIISASRKILVLTDAIEKTLEYNYGIRISKSDVEIAGINNNWGNAGRYPDHWI